MNQGPPIRAIVIKDFDGQPPARAASAWSIFEKNPTETFLELRDGRCAPPFITWMPKGLHCIRPTRHQGDGTGKLIVWQTFSKHAEIADRHCQEMRAKAAAGEAEWPFIDFDHKGGKAGEVLGFFWDGLAGIRAHVRWTPEGEQAVLDGRCKSFSPVFARAGDDLLGITQNCGALLSNDVEPAFGRAMPMMFPVKKPDAMKAREGRFMRLVSLKTAELQKLGDEDYPAVKAFDFVQRSHPELHESYSLLAAIQREFAKDL